MSGATLHTGSGYWNAVGHPLVIEYLTSVMERIRAEAVEGFNRTGAGGFEVGGVLFGTRERDIVRVMAHRPFACEYAMGPAFSLSERDLTKFEALLSLPELDHDLDGLEAVGWYHSHTRQGIYLSERDLDLHNRFFPQEGSIALVLRPDVFNFVRAGFFFREGDGTVRGDSSYCEFDVHAVKRAPAFEPPLPRYEREDLPPLPPMPGLGLPELSEEPMHAGRRRFPWSALLIAILLALVAAASAFYIGFLPRRSMTLEVKEQGGPLRISWDRDSRPIMEARSGLLEIIDGTDRVTTEFDPPGLRQGSVIYTPRSASVDIRLTVERSRGDTHSEYVRFVGQRSPAAAAIPPAGAPIASDPALTQTEAAGQERVQGAEEAPPEQQAEERAAVPAKTPKAKPEPPKTIARFQPPPSSRPAAGGSALPTPPPVRPESGGIEQAAAAPMVDTVPGPPPPVLPLEKPKPVYTGPTRGRLIWTGEVRSNVPISITGSRASYGSLTGQLPGVPVRIQVHPADLTSRGLTVFTLNPMYRRGDSAVEAPGPQNGWNPTVYTWNEKRARSVTVLDAPSPANNWKALVLRGEIDWTPVIIIDWQVASP